ncbi:hypothetical protein [Caballeronia telluris]|uniref:hypothetical protein n=1 Tax=Caballeronia telluris TaxID=326475 RepID=UPI000A9CA843|nr:hypothetical protein [Caballeronia telluris]
MDCRDAPVPAIRTETERNRKARPVSAEAYCAAPPRAVALRQRYLIAKPVLAGIRRALQCTNGRAVATPARFVRRERHGNCSRRSSRRPIEKRFNRALRDKKSNIPGTLFLLCAG